MGIKSRMDMGILKRDLPTVHNHCHGYQFNSQVHDSIRRLLICLFVVPLSTLSGLGQEKVNTNSSVSFLNAEYDVDCIRMPIIFGNLSGDLIVDTGSELSVIDKDYEELCGQQNYEDSAKDALGFTSKIRAYRELPFLFRGESMYLRPVGIVDLHGMQEAVGGPVVGIVGYDFFASNKLCIGFDSSNSRFYLSNGIRMRYENSYSIVGNEDQKPLVDAIVIDTELDPLPYLIDTASNATISLGSKEYNFLKRAGRLTHERGASKISLFGGGRARRAIVDKVSIFGEQFYDVPVFEEKGEQRKIGLAILRKFDFLLDPRTKKFHATRVAKAPKTFACDLSGIAVMQKGTKIIVRHTDTQFFPAAKVVHAGDVITKINNEHISSLPQVRQLLSTYSSSPVRLTVQRNQEVKEIKLELVNPESLGL